MTKSNLKKTRNLTILAALIFSIGLFCNQTQAATFMPIFKLTDAKTGETVDGTSYKGKVVLINFFTTW